MDSNVKVLYIVFKLRKGPKNVLGDYTTYHICFCPNSSCAIFNSFYLFLFCTSVVFLFFRVWIFFIKPDLLYVRVRFSQGRQKIDTHACHYPPAAAPGCCSSLKALGCTECSLIINVNGDAFDWCYPSVLITPLQS